MKKRINEIRNGKFEDLQNTLELSENEISGKTVEKENFCGRFSVLSRNEKSIQGFVYSTNPRMGVKPDSFNGIGETIRYEADVTGLAAGEALTGEFILNTSAGEYHLPYRIAIEGRTEEKNKNVMPPLTREEFTALAKEDFGRAYVLFLSGGFRNRIRSWAAGSTSLYDGLLAKGASYRCLEQFLVGIGQKEAITLEPEQDYIVLSHVAETRKEELVIRKNTWGFATLHISCDAPFLTLEKTQITTEEFLGSVCHVGFVIHREKLHAGKQFARISISTGQEETCCTVEVQREKKSKTSGTLHRQKRETAQILKSYIDYRTGRIEQKIWGKETLQSLDRYRRAEGKHIFYDLYESYVLFQMQDTIHAELILGQTQERKEELKDPRWQSCYLYLTTMQNKDREYLEYVKNKIAELYLEKQESWILQWLMFRVNGQMYRNDGERLEEIRNKYQQGCTSPVMYLEAWEILKKEPLMLRRLEEFEIHLLAFLCREKLFDLEISGQAAQLAGRMQNFHPVLFRVLTACYEAAPTGNLLTAICRLLIEGRKGEKKYARWFALGVMQDVRITGLYEYFVETADHLDAGELPKAIRLYFVYHNTLDTTRKASIYAAIIHNREQDEESYASYRKVMELFMEEQLAEGKISRDLALLYETLLEEEVMNEKLAAGLEKALFTYEVTCDMPGLRQLIVIHKALEQEQQVALQDGKALVQILNSEYVLLAEDREGQRYAAEPFCHKKKLLESEKLETLCRNYLPSRERFLIHDCMIGEKEFPVDGSQMANYLQLMNLKQIKAVYRRELQEKLLDWFAAHSDHPEAEHFLQQIDCCEMAEEHMGEMAKLLAGLDHYQELYDLVSIYGMEKVDLSILVHMCSTLLTEEDREEDKMLLAVCVCCFEQKLYDEKMLAFLMKHYEGSLELMKKIWYAGRTFRLSSFELEERILILLLFLMEGSEETEPIFDSYEKKMGKSWICRAYVTWMAYESFVREKKTDWCVFAYMEQNMLGVVGTPDICKLALLRRYTERKEKSAGQQEWMRYFLERYLEMGMRFAFMMKLPKKIREQYHLYDKYILEYRCRPQANVTLHYSYQGQPEKSVRMEEAFEGIYTKEFTMFYKDTLEWYFTIEEAENVTETVRQFYTFQGPLSQHGVTRYDLINQMIQADESGEEAKYRELDARYAGMQYLVEEIFRLN